MLKPCLFLVISSQEKIIRLYDLPLWCTNHMSVFKRKNFTHQSMYTSNTRAGIIQTPEQAYFKHQSMYTSNTRAGIIQTPEQAYFKHQSMYTSNTRAVILQTPEQVHNLPEEPNFKCLSNKTSFTWALSFILRTT